MNGQTYHQSRNLGVRLLISALVVLTALTLGLSGWCGCAGQAVPPGRSPGAAGPTPVPPVHAPISPGPAPVSGRYTIQDLGTLGGDSYAMGLNNNGQVTGYCGAYKAFFWDPKDGMRDIAKDVGADCIAVGINDGGLVIGQKNKAYGHRAFVWDVRTGYRDLGTAGAPESECCGVNNSGAVVGILLHSSDMAFRWDSQSGTRPLTDLGEGRFPRAINDGGTVAGYRNYAEAWIWHPKTGRKDIGLCRGGQAVPYRINRHDQVVGVGYSGDRAYEPHIAWLWDANGGMRILGTLGGAQSEAYSLNDDGWVVGMAHAQGDKPRAFLCRDGKMIDLNGLLPPGSGWELQAARDINNRGQIVGWGVIQGATRAFLLTPAP